YITSCDLLFVFLFFLLLRRPPRSTLFPYTTLFRSSVSGPAAGLTAIVLTAITDLGAFELFLCAGLIAGILQLILGFVRAGSISRSEEHTSELQSRENLVCRLLLEKKKKIKRH